jgi:tetratricopeptide (TPR) repeat protein
VKAVVASAIGAADRGADRRRIVAASFGRRGFGTRKSGAYSSVALASFAGAVALERTGHIPTEAALDPLLDGTPAMCAPGRGRPPLLQTLTLAQRETKPFPAQAVQAAEGTPPLYDNLGNVSFKAGTADAKAQAYFDQGLRWTFAFNHAEAQRAFRAAQQQDPAFALAHWGEALVLGPNINAPMLPEAVAPAWAALEKAVQLAAAAPEKDRALIAALQKRYSPDSSAVRTELDTAFADAMKQVAAQFPDDDTVATLYAESLMDTQPWDYWEAAGTKPKGRAGDIFSTLEKVLARNPDHPGAIHYYIHAVEASATPERALPHARRLAALMPGAGHIVHMPAHIYYRLGQYGEALAINKRAMTADEAYFRTSPSDPMYKSAYYPHNIHFVLVSAQMGGDGATAIDAAGKLDAALADEVVTRFPALEPIKAAPYLAHSRFSAPATVLALKTPPPNQVLVRALSHYSRALAQAANRNADGAQAEIDAIAALENSADFKPYADWAVPGKEIVHTARLVAQARLADARGDLAAAATAYEAAVAVEDSLAYMEPPYWHYPIRQSLGAVYLRQGRLDEAEQTLRDSLLRVRGNGWALTGLVEVYKRKGDAPAERSAQQALERAWFGKTAAGIDQL